MYKIIKAAAAVCDFFIGRFGRKTLRYPYRAWWVAFWLLLCSYLVFHYIMCPIIRWWDGVVYQLDYIIWG